MSEIEKMYKNVIEKQSYCTAHDCLDMSKCENCYFCKRIYPPFTAEKQIKITKFLISKYARFKKFRSYEQKDLYMVYYECRYYPKQYLPFGEALAESINYLWQDLTEEEKQQIKDILK